LYIRWQDINGSLVYDYAAYMSLMKNFQNLGYFEDYDSCYEQYMQARRNQVDEKSFNNWTAKIKVAYWNLCWPLYILGLGPR